MQRRKNTHHPMAQSLGYLLKRAQHALRTTMDKELGPLGLTAPQYNVLSAVERQPGISNASLARAAFVTAQSMQGIVANLERMGLLHRAAHPTHGRIRRSELTQIGIETLARAHTVLAGVEQTMTSGLQREEIERVRLFLLRCAENMQSA